MDQVDWSAVHARDFRDEAVKEGKQAEFLVEGWFPWSLATRIGVHSQAIKTKVTAALSSARHKPAVDILPGWYY